MQLWLTEQTALLVFAAVWVTAFGLQYGWLRKMKHARAPWLVWLMAAVLLLAGGLLTEQAGNQAKNRIEKITLDFARLYASETEQRGHWKLPNNVAENDPTYLRLIEAEKNWERLNPEISDIYTLRKLPDGKNVFIVDSETDYNHNGKYDGERERRTRVGEVYNVADEGLERAFRGKPNFDFVPITDRWGTWVSAFVPLRDPAGRLDGVLGVDFDAGAFAATIADARFRIIGLLAVALVVLLGLSTLNAVLHIQIAERMQARESLQLLGAAVEQSKESIVITDTQLDLPGPKILFVNPAFSTMTGYSAAEALGKTPRILQGPRTDKATTRRLRQCLEKGEVFTGEVINYRKDGTEYFVEWQVAPIRAAGGKITHFVAIQRDVTARKQAEAALRDSEERYRSLINNARDAIFTIAPDGTFTSLNPAVEAIAGFSRTDWLGKPFAPMVHPDDLPLAAEMFARVLKGEQVPVHELRGHPGLKRPALMEMTLSAQKDGNGKIIGVLGVGRDITERKRLEAQLFQSQKMETVGKLAGGIAHEFNSIMTAIIGQSELLAADLPSGNPLRHNANEIRKAADRAATLTRQLLAYGRKQLLQPEILDLNRILSGMENVLHHLVGRNVDVRLVPAAGLKPVKADAGQIEEVIVNMVMNAADAMPNGGKLTLETANVALDSESVGRFPELKAGDYVMLAISDTGTGMSDEVRAHVFEPFFSTKDVGRGTGLGLATCYGILKQSGGHISVYSEPGRGSTFKIYLPQAQLAPRAPVLPLDVADLPRGIETILLVEDDDALREMAATLLGRLGYHMLTAANGLEALNLTHQPAIGHIDLLFTDVVMPQMSGKELASRIRSLFPRTKILFTSAYTEGAIVHQGVLDHGVALLQKPFTPSALAGKVREILDAENARA